MYDILKNYFTNPVKVIVLCSFIYCILSLNYKERMHKYLLAILVICFLTECTNTVLIVLGKSTALSTTLGTIVHHSAWLLLLGNFVYFKTAYKFLFFIFGLICITNLCFIEGTEIFNYYTFVSGAFIYISIFIHECFYKLQHESFSFFTSNNFILLSSPLILFFGLSFYFAFKSYGLGEIKIYYIKFYDIIVFFVDIIYYSLINIYIYREKKPKNV